MPKILNFQDFRLAQGPHGSPEAPGPPAAGTAPAALPGVPAPRQAGARGCRQRGRHSAQGGGCSSLPCPHPAQPRSALPPAEQHDFTHFPFQLGLAFLALNFAKRRPKPERKIIISCLAKRRQCPAAAASPGGRGGGS